MFRICLAISVAVFGHSLFADAVNTSVQSTAAEHSTPSAWQAAAASQYTDMGSVGNALSGSTVYSFRDIQTSNENLTLEYQTRWAWAAVVKAQYITKYYEEVLHTGVQNQRSNGMGDTLAGVTYALGAGAPLHFVLDGGVLLPTGSYNEFNPYSPGHHYSYRMQLGSGTYDGLLAATALYEPGIYALGAKLSSLVRTGQNTDGYRLGNQYRADAWADLPLKYGLTPRLVGYYRLISTASGNDDTVTLSATEYYLSTQMDWRVSAALRYSQALWGGVNLSVEGGIPVAQYMTNSDHLNAHTRYYGTLSMVGQY